MDHYSTFDKVMIILTAMLNITALVGGVGTLIYLIKTNRKL